MTSQRILVTGGAGFVGSHVVEHLLAVTPHCPALRVLVHHRAPAHLAGAPAGRGVEIVRGSLSDPAGLHGICDGVTTVLHLAARIGGTEEECRLVNTEGTRALLAEAKRAGVGNFIQLGTAAVYGNGPHRGAAEGMLDESPTSPTSVTRLAGERLVVAAGGTVLRPYLIYGDGDTWLIPALVGLIRRVPRWPAGGRARLSLVSVDSLAAAIAELALLPRLPTGQVLHASHPEPVTVRDLITTVARHLEIPEHQGEFAADEAAERLGAPDDPLIRRQLAMLTTDRWYNSDRFWKAVSTDPGPSFENAFVRYSPWYRSHHSGEAT
ncbi:NAD-dependent epimerase/dehydratase family protein [Streptomyces sp. CA-210063]|uniref:NAD-dependent epimerase/dehydratase family protein n=1 Tax=Streptomyces sp. CA-210063 TaxID=2801029 RepID=UPI00214D0BD4|nr:NAD-dependent epimerase/dehydratase family protein [Streptomyces sp. CA-210063]UUU30232.1 NAD-dependent epimerase/dehydratase family protein [Streptomyces sp. CA-210063]